MPDKVSLSFWLDSIIERQIWCSVFAAAAAKFDLAGHTVVTSKSVSIGIVCISYGKHFFWKCNNQFCYQQSSTDMSLTVMLVVPDSALDELARVFQTMRPLIRKCCFKSVCVKHEDVSRVCADVLEESSTEELWLKMLDEETNRKYKSINSYVFL